MLPGNTEKESLIYIECSGKTETPKLGRDSWINRKVYGKGGRQERAFTEVLAA